MGTIGKQFLFHRCALGMVQVGGKAHALGELPAAGVVRRGPDGRPERGPDEVAGHVGRVDPAPGVGGQFVDDALVEHLRALDPDVDYVVYCRSGNRSAVAAKRMRAIGLDVLDGGAMDDMTAAGWPTA